jgi:hypothetical protein
MEIGRSGELSKVPELFVGVHTVFLGTCIVRRLVMGLLNRAETSNEF